MRSMEQLFELLHGGHAGELHASSPHLPFRACPAFTGASAASTSAPTFSSAADGTDLNDYWDEINRVVSCGTASATRSSTS
jgi:hypothetical protein